MVPKHQVFWATAAENDLKDIISREWQLFNDIFGNGKAAKRQLNEKIQAIVKVRNPLAHNRDVPKNELKRTEVFCTDILIQIQQAQNTKT